MRIVTWTDNDGYQHRALLRDSDPDEVAPHRGIWLDPPSLADLGISEGLKRDLHNALLQRGLASYADVLRQQDGVTGAVRAVAARHKLNLQEAAAVRRAVILKYRTGG